MYMSKPTSGSIPRRPIPQITSERMRRYFSPPPPPIRTIIVTVIAFLLFVSLFSTNVAFSLCALGIGAIGIFRLVLLAKATPNDQEYDEWVRGQASLMASRARQKLNIDKRQLISRPLRVYSFVLPGSSVASVYPPEEVRMKRGKDGIWRFSINVYTFFFAAERYLAVYTGDVNALNQSAPHVEETEEYFYDDIVGATTYSHQDAAIIESVQYRYRIQKFSLRISNGDVIDLGAYISATPIGNYQNAPDFSVPITNIDQTLAELRALLRYMK